MLEKRSGEAAGGLRGRRRRICTHGGGGKPARDGDLHAATHGGGGRGGLARDGDLLVAGGRRPSRCAADAGLSRWPPAPCQLQKQVNDLKRSCRAPTRRLLALVRTSSHCSALRSRPCGGIDGGDQLSRASARRNTARVPVAAQDVEGAGGRRARGATPARRAASEAQCRGGRVVGERSARRRAVGRQAAGAAQLRGRRRSAEGRRGCEYHPVLNATI
ncbi:hypothetical protein PVAP13_9NG304892 [Panicum virgatum]|uniref:Uncharacterized protein n=1 Tax=Panicum virgatum TaxID=38727 RepID=A0A8T0MQA6_PANVG|nr:hypothetical protein PVAP13_9NG304892 [Panicum virgatum]